MSGSTSLSARWSDDARRTIVDFCRSKNLSDNDMEQLDAILDEIAAGNPTLATDSRRWRPTDAASTIMRRLQEIRAAEAEVEPVVGSVLGMDSAGAIYGEALRRLGRDPRGLQGTAVRVGCASSRCGHVAPAFGFRHGTTRRTSRAWPSGHTFWTLILSGGAPPSRPNRWHQSDCMPWHGGSSAGGGPLTPMCWTSLSSSPGSKPGRAIVLRFRCRPGVGSGTRATCRTRVTTC